MISPKAWRSPSTYIERRLTDGGELLAWAEAQGFEHRLPLSELHVTVALARSPADSLPISADPSDLTASGGKRRVVHLDHGVVGLAFEAPSLEARRRELRRGGAELREPFRPHVTFAFDPSIDVFRVAPFSGPLRFGPEIVRVDQFASFF